MHAGTRREFLKTVGITTAALGGVSLQSEGDDLPYYPDMFRSAVEYKLKMDSFFAEVRRRDRAGWMDWYAWALPVDIAPAFQRRVESIGDRWNDQKFADFITKMGRLKMPLEQCFDVQVADRTCERLKALKNSQNPFMILYNLRKDPGETVDLIDDPKSRPVREDLAAEMDSWLDRTGWTGHRNLTRKVT